MRRILASAAALSLAALTLLGCSASDDPAASCTRESDVGTAASLVDVSADGSLEDVTVTAPVYAEDVSYVDVRSGEGEPITESNQLARFDLALYNGDTGEAIADTGYAGESGPLYSLDDLSVLAPGLFDALECATPGSRVAAVIPSSALDSANAASLGLGEDSTAVIVVDIYDVIPTRADGATQFNTGHNLPAVVLAPDGRPGITVPDVDPPTDLVVETLKKGDGETVEAGDTVVVQYTGLTWADGTVFDTTWDSQPASLSLDGVVEGFGSGLEGATVGSQVLLVIPPDLGYGDQEQSTIPAGSTLVFVVDILAIDNSATTTQ